MNSLTFTGSLSMRQRADVVEKFKSRTEHKALLISLRAVVEYASLDLTSSLSQNEIFNLVGMSAPRRR